MFESYFSNYWPMGEKLVTFQLSSVNHLGVVTFEDLAGRESVTHLIRVSFISVPLYVCVCIENCVCLSFFYV